jgi:hypothetical protein
MTDEELAIRENEIMVTGAIMMVIYQMGPDTIEIVTGDHNDVWNAVWITVPWMKSRYRITVTMDPEGEPARV